MSSMVTLPLPSKSPRLDDPVGVGLNDGLVVGEGLNEGLRVGTLVGDGEMLGLIVGDSTVVGETVGEGALVGLGAAVGEGERVGVGVAQAVMLVVHWPPAVGQQKLRVPQNSTRPAQAQVLSVAEPSSSGG